MSAGNVMVLMFLHNERTHFSNRTAIGKLSLQNAVEHITSTLKHPNS
jgi:hypothetical protein